MATIAQPPLLPIIGTPSSSLPGAPHRIDPLDLVQSAISEIHALRRTQILAADKIPLALQQGSTPPDISMNYLRDLSNGMREDQTILANVKKTMTEHRSEFFKVANLPKHVTPATVYPPASDLAMANAFGKTNLCKSYCVCPNLLHIAVILWKSDFLDPTATTTLAAALPRGQTVLKKLRLLAKVDFRALQLPPLDYDADESQEIKDTIQRNKRTLRDACLLHYNMDLATVQRYCQGRWMGQHRRTDEMLRIMSHILPDKLFLQLGAGLIDGVPNYLHGSIETEELDRYMAEDNLPSVQKMPDLVDKAINKEETRHLSMVFSRQMARYTPNIGIIKLGILNHKHKKPRMYRHGSYVLGRDSHPINKLVDIKLSEPEIGYGTVLHRHCTFLWRIAGTYPNDIIDVYDDDVSGAFPQLTFHPELAKANVSLHDDKMILAVSLHFGGNFGPSSWEPISDARCFLAQWLYKHAQYHVTLNGEALALITKPKHLRARDRCTIVPRLTDIHTPVTDASGNFIPEFNMFVDDLLSATPRSKGDTDKLLASSIEAVYILIGYPGPIQAPLLPPTMAWDKMVDRPVGPSRVSLGIKFKTNRLVLSIEDYKVERVLEILRTTWSKNRKAFTAIQAAVLIGNIVACTQVCPWLRWSLHHLVEALKNLLRANSKRLQRSPDFQQILAEDDEGWLDPPTKIYARFICFNRSFMRAIWRCNARTFISKAIREEVDFVKEQGKEHLSGKKLWERPISHVVDRRADGHIRQDACTSWGMGGGSADLGYWWQISWMELDPEIVTCIQNGKDGKLPALYINELELAAAVVNYFAAAAVIKNRRTKFPWQPKVACSGDNTSANSWYNRFSNTNPQARKLTKLLALGQKSSGLDMDITHVAGVNNCFADAVSRGDPKVTLQPLMKAKIPTNELALSCLQVQAAVQELHLHRFLLSPLLLSEIACALLRPGTAKPQMLVANKCGQTIAGSTIGFNFANDWTWTLGYSTSTLVPKPLSSSRISTRSQKATQSSVSASAMKPLKVT